jgi:hypothetical protein
MNMFVFWKNEKGEQELVTPPLDGTILPGVTRLVSTRFRCACVVRATASAAKHLGSHAGLDVSAAKLCARKRSVAAELACLPCKQGAMVTSPYDALALSQALKRMHRLTTPG